LTGLFSRAYFESELRRLDSPRQLSLSIVLVNINKFKLINDVLGHGVGDQFLRFVAQKLRKVSRQEDIVARFGGDEFVLLLPQTSHCEALKVAERLSFWEEVPLDSSGFPVSLAFGVATKNRMGQSLNEVLLEAEKGVVP